MLALPRTTFPETVKSFSAVIGPLTFNVSVLALPRTTFPFNVETPETVIFVSTDNEPLTVKLFSAVIGPLTVNVSVLESPITTFPFKFVFWFTIRVGIVAVPVKVGLSNGAFNDKLFVIVVA